jgi:hypothetical protein
MSKYFISMILRKKSQSIYFLFFVVDEGSAQPNPILAKIRQLSEETMKIAHSMKLVKTQDEASKETADSDEDI